MTIDTDAERAKLAAQAGEGTMSKILWKDATSYRQGQRGKVEPTAWESIVNGVCIWVSCGHRWFPDSWVMNCHPLDIREIILCDAGETADHAQSLALRMVVEKARKRIVALNAVISAIPLTKETPDDDA